MEEVVKGNITKVRILGLLKELRMTQKELAHETNLTEGAISHYLRGDRVPKGAILLNIAYSLGTTKEYLTGLSDEPHQAQRDQELEMAYRVLSRNAVNMTDEEKNNFARVLFGSRGRK